MTVLEKLNYLSKLTIEEYDNAGGHIRDHLVPLKNIISVLEDSDKKQRSVFLTEKIAEEAIHQALSNKILQLRIQRWCTHSEYQMQTRMIIGYKMDHTIGYLYELKEPSEQGYLALAAKECQYLCMVILRDSTNPQDFILYSAYPKTENTTLTLQKKVTHKKPCFKCRAFLLQEYNINILQYYIYYKVQYNAFRINA